MSIHTQQLCNLLKCIFQKFNISSFSEQDKVETVSYIRTCVCMPNIISTYTATTLNDSIHQNTFIQFRKLAKYDK